jgi:nucleoside-diphosphate-sugar epimerase
VAAAALRGDISAYISLSPTIYGAGSGPGNSDSPFSVLELLSSSSLHFLRHTELSLQIPAYVKYAKQNGQAAYIGKGENIWGNVHVKDVSRLNIKMLQRALDQPDSTKASAASQGWENLIYTGVEQHAWGPVIQTLGDLLYARGDVKQPSAKSIPEGEGIMYMFGGNSFLAPSKKAKAFDWVPQEKDLISSMRDALPANKQ